VNEPKPTTQQEYLTWLKQTAGAHITLPRLQTRFDSVTAKINSSFTSSSFWSQLKSSLAEYNDQYYLNTDGYFLLTNLQPPPEIVTKPFESFLLKTQRRNILENPNWPSPPQEGWLLPDNWYSRIPDVVRTRFTVKYLDGVDFMVQAIASLCGEHACQSDISYEAREEGYYAAHLIVHSEADIPGETWDSLRIPVALEIQITTQLQEVIGRLLHKYYERRRSLREKPDLKWQWNYESDEFITNYLGHILHYAEGMIMEVRTRQAASSSPQSPKEAAS
jgi:ppGpp synthetase/RelA/SpoT-type nucleotidyltranferase